MRTQYEIELVRNERGVWSAPWELYQARTPASDQAVASVTPSERHSPQDSYSWQEWLRALIPSWKGAREVVAQTAA